MSSIWFWLSLASTVVAVFFSVTCYALGGLSPALLRGASAKPKHDRRIAGLSEHRGELLQILVVLRLFFIIAVVVFVHLWVRESTGGPLWATVLTLITAVIVLTVFVGLIPLAWARYAGAGVLLRAAPMLLACRSALGPFRKVFKFFDILVSRLAGVPAGDRQNHIEEHLRTLVAEGEREGAIDEDEKQMIEGIFEFGQADAANIMTPRTDIVSIEADASLGDVGRVIMSKGHSRIPVQEGSLDTIVGVLYAKDLIAELSETDGMARRVKEVMRKAIFVPETKKLDELLRKFQSAKVHIAIVLDEYGGTAGLVTIEDVLEEIVGEIADEYETKPEPMLEQVGERTFDVDARVHIDDVNEEMEVALPEDDDYETVGGFVFSALGYIPKVGEVFERDGLRFTVLDAEQRRINKVRIEILRQDVSDA